MRRVILSASAFILLLLLISALGLSAAPNPHIADTDPRSPADEAKALHLPPGFEIQLVASEPDIHKPLNIDFDDRGRLWVSQTVEYPFPTGPDGKLKHQDAVKILDDFGPDGRARKITTFADKLDIPIGVLPMPARNPQDALIYSIPTIWRMRDAGSGEADQRTPLYSKYGYKDTHGMTSNFTWGFDGWVYACHGFSNESTVKGGDKEAITMQSGNIYRFRADGSHLEYFVHGMVNPFGLAFDPLGNLYSCDCETKPFWQLLRGGYYPSFGKPDDGLGFAPTAVDQYHDSTAIAGVAYYAADMFPKDHRNNAFVGDVVTNRVNEFRLTWKGTTPIATKQDFLLSDDRWFRPVQVKLGPDGALYIADFYNRIIGHYEVPLDNPGRDHTRGRIWRIVYCGPNGRGPIPPPLHADWTKKNVAELMKDLGNANLAVRFKATNELVTRGGKEAVTAVMGVMKRKDKPEAGDTWRRMHGLWVLDRLGALDDATLTAAAKEKEFGVRVHAQRVLAERAQVDQRRTCTGDGRPKRRRPERTASRRRWSRPSSGRRQPPAAAGTGIQSPRRRHASDVRCPYGSAQPAVGRHRVEGDPSERLGGTRRPRHRGRIARRPESRVRDVPAQAFGSAQGGAWFPCQSYPSHRPLWHS